MYYMYVLIQTYAHINSVYIKPRQTLCTCRTSYNNYKCYLCRKIKHIKIVYALCTQILYTSSKYF